MSYIGAPFEHDIFVSYAHGVAVDDVPPLLRTWSHRLVDLLKAEILNTRGEYRPLAIFIDRDRDPTLGLTADLKARAEASAILLIVMSQFYLESSWCRDEGDWFQAQLKSRGRGDGFFFVVRAMPTDGKDWPLHLNDERGFPLVSFSFHADPAEDHTKPFGWPYPQPGNPEYWSFHRELSTLAGAVMRRLRELRDQQFLLEQAVASSRASVPAVRRLYLSQRPDQVGVWQEVRDYLAACAFEVWPDPNRSAAKEGDLDPADQRLAECSECDAVLILRHAPGEWIDNEIGLARTDRALLQADYGRRLPFLVLDRVGGDLPKAKQFKLPVIPANSPGWLLQLQLQLSTASARELVA